MGTLIAAALCVSSVAAVRPRTLFNLGQSTDSYWGEKSVWREKGDVVLAGDSRILEAVSPAELKKSLGSERVILNYGFAGNGFTDEYLAAVERLLRKNGKDPLIVLGVTPHSLTLGACQTNGFLELRKPAPPKSAIATRLNEQLDKLKPVRIKEVPSLLLSSSRFAQSHYYEYHDDGWIGAWQSPENLEEGVTYYRERFYENPVRDDVEQRLVAAVSRWRAAGIRVIGFRPPSSQGVIDVEDQLGRFDESAFAGRFERAGGRWLTVSQTAYGSYDGSHLRKEEALRFTRDLGALLSAQ